MLKIALIDHHLNNYHADTFLRLLREKLADQDAQIVAAWESSPVGDDWCAKNDVVRVESPEAAIAAADAVMLLAPDNIEDHLELAKAVLPFGKPTFFDKLLATNTADAREIMALAARHNAPIFSSSALRYAVELEALLPQISANEVSDLFVCGINDWDRYGIHTLAIALRIMGAEVHRVIDTGRIGARTVTLDYGDNRRAVLDVRHASNEGEFFSWRFAAHSGEPYIGAEIKDSPAFYENVLRQVIGFLKTGKSDMPIADAFAGVAIIEAANQSLHAGGVWVDIKTATQ